MEEREREIVLLETINIWQDTPKENNARYTSLVFSKKRH